MQLLQVLALPQKVLLCHLLGPSLHPQDMLTMGRDQLALRGCGCPAWAPWVAAPVPGRAGSWEVAPAGLSHWFSPMNSAARYAGDGHLPGPESPVQDVGEKDRSLLPR